jgi:cysteine-rich repeat protein
MTSVLRVVLLAAVLTSCGSSRSTTPLEIPDGGPAGVRADAGTGGGGAGGVVDFWLGQACMPRCGSSSCYTSHLSKTTSSGILLMSYYSYSTCPGVCVLSGGMYANTDTTKSRCSKGCQGDDDCKPATEPMRCLLSCPNDDWLTHLCWPADDPVVTDLCGSAGQPDQPACGDGVNNQGGIEECDDGNALPGDGCNDQCKVEPNWACPQAGTCTRKVMCGDGSIGPGEACDDGNTRDGDGCDSTCMAQDPAFDCDPPGTPCVRVSQCGNNRIEPGEQCDDGNTNSGDGCSSSCQLDSGWVCPVPGEPCQLAARGASGSDYAAA